MTILRIIVASEHRNFKNSGRIEYGELWEPRNLGIYRILEDWNIGNIWSFGSSDIRRRLKVGEPREVWSLYHHEKKRSSLLSLCSTIFPGWTAQASWCWIVLCSRGTWNGGWRFWKLKLGFISLEYLNTVSYSWYWYTASNRISRNLRAFEPHLSKIIRTYSPVIIYVEANDINTAFVHDKRTRAQWIE